MIKFEVDRICKPSLTIPQSLMVSTIVTKSQLFLMADWHLHLKTEKSYSDIYFHLRKWFMVIHVNCNILSFVSISWLKFQGTHAKN